MGNNKLVMKLLNQIAIIAILLAAIFGLYKLWQSEKSERIRVQSNQESLILSHKKQMDLTLQLTKEELTRFKPELLKTIKDSLNLKTKQITNITTNQYNYTYDSIKVALTPRNDSMFQFKHSFDNCLSIAGRVDVFNKDLYFDTPILNYKSTSAAYWKKTKRFLFIPYHKELFQKTYNNCTGKSRIEKIEIVK
jgi:hypothetical protein